MLSSWIELSVGSARRSGKEFHEVGPATEKASKRLNVFSRQYDVNWLSVVVDGRQLPKLVCKSRPGISELSPARSDVQQRSVYSCYALERRASADRCAAEMIDPGRTWKNRKQAASLHSGPYILDSAVGVRVELPTSWSRVQPLLTKPHSYVSNVDGTFSLFITAYGGKVETKICISQ